MVTKKIGTMIIEESDVFTSNYDENTKIASLVWKDNPTMEEYQQGFNSVLEVHKKSPIPFFYSDIRGQGVTSPDKRKWFENVALPQAIEGGLKKAAVVTNANPFKKYYLNVVLSASKKFNLPFKICSSSEEAEQWLLS